MNILTGRTAFITGSAQGIGLGIAKACLKEGMQVVIADVKTEQLKVAELTLDSPENVLTIELDVRDRDAMEVAADKTEAAFEKVHVVCNNAGIGSGGPVMSVTWENWQALGTHLFNPIYDVLPPIPPMSVCYLQ
ncbi:MAG: SDR family NAD(P)-dependent oxidoreductase [Candidatus Poribacteria bacterium]|nr:SDR family NAD(P)-dependent oxidoreductase [Candidatus Poribacteria bacterium]